MWLNAQYKLRYGTVAAGNESYVNGNDCYGAQLNVMSTKGLQCPQMFVGTGSGYFYDYSAASFYRGYANTTATYNQRTIHFGSGTTPVTANDYKMESEITTGLTYIGVSHNYLIDDGQVIYNLTYKNSGSSEITISELGISCYVIYGQSSQSTSSSRYAGRVLIYHEILDNPLTVLAGETFTVSITETFPMPIAE